MKADKLRWTKPWGFSLTVAAFFIAIIILFLPPAMTFSSATVSAVLGLTLCLYIGTSLHLFMIRPTADLVRPKVVLFKPESAGLFLVSPAEWLSYRSAYTLFVAEDDGFERLLGLAEVSNIQDDKKVQLLIFERAVAADGVWRSLDSGSTDYFKKIIIKPGAPR